MFAMHIATHFSLSGKIKFCRIRFLFLGGISVYFELLGAFSVLLHLGTDHVLKGDTDASILDGVNIVQI
jgi:hypothetical protein